MSDSVVYESIDCFLENSLLITQDNIRSIYFFKFFQTIIAIDNTSIKIVDIRRSVAPTIKRHHRTNGWWNNRNTYQKHPFWSDIRVNHPLHSTHSLVQTSNFY